MHAVARRFLSHDEDRADAVQEAFLAAYRSIRSFEGRSALWTWLCRVQINTCLAIRHPRSRPRVLSLDSLPRRAWEHGRPILPGRRWSEPADARAERAETRAQVRNAIERLPQPYRDVLFLRDIEGLDTDQTAKRLGTPPSTVKTRLHRARQALRIRLEPLLRRQA